MITIIFTIVNFVLVSAEGTGTIEPSKPAAPKWPLPWKEKVTYEFSWYLQNRKTGKSTFTLNWDKKKQTISCNAKLDLSSRGSDLKALFHSTYKNDMEPVSYISGFEGKIGKQKTGDAGMIVHFAKKKITIRAGSFAGDVKTVQRPDKRFFLSGGHAVHHWALFMPFIDKTRKSKITLFMPDIREFLDVTFTPDGKENTRGIEATKLKFTAANSKTGQTVFFGDVWVAPDGRLLRYRQPNATGTLNVWISRKTMKNKD